MNVDNCVSLSETQKKNIIGDRINPYQNIPNNLTPISDDEPQRQQELKESLLNMVKVCKNGYDNRHNKRICQTADELESQWVGYVIFCAEHKAFPKLKGFASWLGCSYDVFKQWNLGRSEHDKAMSNRLEFLKTTLSDLFDDLALKGTIKSDVYRFIAGNYFGMTDKVEHVITPNNPLQSEMTQDDINRMIPDGVIDVDAE